MKNRKAAGKNPDHRPRTGKVPTDKEDRIVQLIVFSSGEQEFAVEIGQIREIIGIGPITPVPNSPHFTEGVINVRGEIIVVISFASLFSLRSASPAESKHVVITRTEKNAFGLMVDEVTEVLRVPESELKPSPELVGKKQEGYIRAVLTVGGRLIILLDMTRVLSVEEFTRLAELSKSDSFPVGVEGKLPDHGGDKQVQDSKPTPQNEVVSAIAGSIKDGAEDNDGE